LFADVYIAILCRDTGSIWGVHFPDLPGCTSVGRSKKEAVANASVALRLWAEGMVHLPRPTPFEDLRERPDVLEDLASGGIPIRVAPDLGQGDGPDPAEPKT
jgi:predicted RNase H-like HicB family nuclease